MAKITRRGFLKQTSVGMAATGVLTTVSLAEAHNRPAAAAKQTSPTMYNEPVVAHVRDAATGEVALMVGTREIVYRDPALVARLLKAVH